MPGGSVREVVLERRFYPFGRERLRGARREQAADALDICPEEVADQALARASSRRARTPSQSVVPTNRMP